MMMMMIMMMLMLMMVMMMMMNTSSGESTSVLAYYNFLFTELSDPRTNDWFLVSSPLPGLTLLGLYLYFVNSWGPRYMKHRPPFELKRTLIVYNLVQVLISVYLFYVGLTKAWLAKYSWKCEPVDFSNSDDALAVATAVHTYFLAKLTELLDTVFFVLRKKDSQVTFLHLYHHTVMPMISWGATKYFPGGHGTFIGFINSFVHIIMYTYYLLAAFGPTLKKYLWWKKYITTLQLLQFCIAFLHSMQLLFYDCGYPRWSTCFTMPNAIFFYYLFYDFYSKAYSANEKKRERKHADVKTHNADDNVAIFGNGFANEEMRTEPNCKKRQ